MRMVDLIHKKQLGTPLTTQEINFIVEGYTKEEIPDYQMAAWAMAIYFKGMTQEEAAALTMAMANSGELVDLSAIHGIKVDKHSTGGVGDTTTLILAPLVASCGVSVAKMSGRGLGHTGGTLDKLEAIPGFQVEKTPQEFIDEVNKDGLAVIGQSGNITPADKKIYALRDVTSIVESIPLIASSIMSKKIAAGADAIVLDVKTGSGAFMKDVDSARQLAQTMVDIGKEVGRTTLAVISDMNQPLGCAVGNALEVKEAIETLQGKGPEDLTELCLVLGAQMLLASELTDTLDEGKALLKEKINNGEALEKFRQLIQNHGGDPRVVDNVNLLPQAKYLIDVPAPKTGVVSSWAANQVGEAAMLLGAGRATKEAKIDLAVGVVLHKKIGDAVEADEPLATLYTNQKECTTIIQKLLDAVTIEEQAEVPSLIHEVIL